MFLLCLGFFSSPSSPFNTASRTSSPNSSTVSAAVGINKQINFQGKLVNANGTNVTNGSYSIVFSIYTVSSAGTAVWTETQTPTVTDGIFQVQLGAVTSLPGSVDFNTDNIYLGIKVGADAEMTPRIRFGSVPQAFNAEKLGGIDNTGFAQLAPGAVQGVNSANTAIRLNQTGAGNLLQLQGNGSDVLTLTKTGNLSVTGTYNTNTFLSNELTFGGASSTSIQGALNQNLTVRTQGGGELVLQSASGTISIGSTTTLTSGGAALNLTPLGGTNLNVNLSGAGDFTVNTDDLVVDTATGNTSFGGSVTVAANQSLTITGGATGSRPASPTEGMMFFDTTTKQLLTYSNGKWQATNGEYVIVAASNSTQAIKDAAHYVADGDNVAGAGTIDGDQVQINAALTAASGGKVYLAQGTYVADATILIPNNTTMAGAGRGTLIELADIDINESVIENSDQATGTGVVIRDLRVDGRNDLNTAGIQYGITLLGTTKGSSAGHNVQNVQATRFRTSGLHIFNTFSVVVTNSSFENNVRGVYIGDSDYIELNNNTYANNSDGLLSYRADYITVADSFFKNHTADAINPDTDNDYWTITGNVINNTTEGAIATYQMDYAMISGNVINTAGYGILIDGVGNVVSGNGMRNLNHASYGDGVYIDGAENVVTGNRISTANGFGIYSWTGANSIISDNIISDTADAGISMGSSSNDASVKNNRIYNAGGATANNAIVIEAFVDRIHIVGNSISDASCTTTCYAISINASSSDNIYLADNILNGATINDLSGGDSIYGGQVDASGNYDIQPSGSISLLKNTDVTGTITVSSNATILGGTATLGTATQVGSLVIHDGNGGQTATIQVGNIAANTILTLPTTLGATDTFCFLTLANCASTLQSAYNNDVDGGDSLITLSSTDDSIVVLNPSSGGTDSAYVLKVAQLNTGSITNGLLVTHAGGSDTYAFRVNDDGTETDSTPFMVDQAGRVGIGTDNPNDYLDIVATFADTIAASNNGVQFNITDTGIVTTGTDSIDGLDINVTRTGATGGTINSTGISVDVTGDAGGTSTATGLLVNVQGADTNYAAILLGGRVGIGTAAPQSQLYVYEPGNRNVLIGVERSNNIYHAATEYKPQGAIGPSNVTWLNGMPANGNNYSIWSWNGTANTYHMTISNSGNTSFNGSVSVAANQSITLVGSATAQRPASPTEGMIYFDTTTKQLITYSNGKWQSGNGDYIIVAASDSSQAHKDAAHYVTDGNTVAAADGDQVQINAALTAAAGGKVYLAPGTYVADETILIPNNTALTGAGRNTLIELADLDVTDNLIEGTDGTTGTGVVIQDLRIDGRKDLNTAGVQVGIYLTNSGNVAGGRGGAKIERIEAHNFRSYNLRLQSSENNTVSSSLFTGSITTGIYLNSSGKNVITGNISRGNTEEGIFLFNGSHGNSITGNVASNNGKDGIMLWTSNENAVSGNTFDSNAQYGIFVYQASSDTITGNTVSNSTFSGMYIWESNRITISGNTSSNNAGAGIFLDVSDNNNINGNGLHDNGGATLNNGIYVQTSDSNSITSNRITDTSATTANNAMALSDATSDNNYFADNYFDAPAVFFGTGTNTTRAGQISAAGSLRFQVASGSIIQFGSNVTVDGDITQVGDGVNALGDSGSILPNAGFEVNEDGATTVADNWDFAQTVATATASVTSTNPGQGSNTQQMTMSAAASEGTFTSACVPISPSQTYTLSLRYRGAAAVSNTMDTFLDTYTTKANCIAKTSVTAVAGSANVASTTSWGGYTANTAASTTATWARVRIRLGSGTLTATTLFIDAVRLTPSTLNTGIDLAENFPALKSDDLKPGELVSFGAPAPEGGSYAVRSNSAYDNNAFGVVSTQPGLTLDDGGAYEKVAVALTGRVPVKVNTENGAIAVGDPITASSVPGVGMKATQAGRIIGTAVTALEADESGQGTITVLINPEFYAPPMSNTLQANSATFGTLQAGTVNATNLNITGTATIQTLIVLTDATIEGTLTATNLVVKETLTVEGQLISKGKAPQVAAANSTIMSELVEVTVEGTDTVGTITIKTKENANTALLAGEIAQLTFVKAYAGTPKALISGNNASSAELGAYIVKTHEGFKLVSDKPLQANTTYSFEYFVMGFEAVASD